MQFEDYGCSKKMSCHNNLDVTFGASGLLLYKKEKIHLFPSD